MWFNLKKREFLSFLFSKILLIISGHSLNFFINTIWQITKKYQKGEFSLDNQLRNNILEFFKLSGVQATKRIIAVGKLEENKIVEKDTVILGFTGTFKTNVNLPDLIALGKRKSVGFGIIKRIKVWKLF